MKGREFINMATERLGDIFQLLVYKDSLLTQIPFISQIFEFLKRNPSRPILRDASEMY